MQVTVEEVSSVKKILHIEIPDTEVSSELDAAYKNLKKTAKVKGFRPGKAPRSVLERMFKKDVHADVSGKLIQEAFIDALKETRLAVLGNPQIDPPELTPGEAYTFDATVEIKPVIDKIDFNGLSIKKTMYAPTDDEIDGQIQMLRKNLGKREAISEDRPAEDGELILIDCEGKVDGKPFDSTPKSENFPYKIGNAIYSRDFDEQLIGMKAGETKTFEVVFADSYINKELAGNTVEFTVTLKEIHQEILPEVDDEMAKQLGPFQTMEEVKNEIFKNLNSGYEKRMEQEMQEQIFEGLGEKTDFELPEIMVEYELDGIISEAKKMFSANGVTMEQIGQSEEQMREQYREIAEKQVKRHLILGAVVEHENLELTDEELEAGYEELSKSFNHPVEMIKKFYEANSDKIELFKHTLLEKKAIALIIENSSVEEVQPELETKAEESEEA